MSKRRQSPDPDRRRFLKGASLAGAAAAGTFALASEPAAAQRCIGPPPPHIKGPAVWLDLDQEELDDAYDQGVYAFNASSVVERYAANSEKALSIIGDSDRVAYGPAETDKVDIYRTARPNAPVMIFIHGGAWRTGRFPGVPLYAEMFVKAGSHFVSVDFNNVLETKGDLFPMVDQCRRAVAFTYGNAASFGGNAGEIYLCGFSSGSHLSGCVVTTEWEKLGLPRDIIKGAALGSGLYDLKAVRLSKRGNYVKFTDEMEEALSPQRHVANIHTPLVLVHGTLETPEFQRQTRDFAAALKATGKTVQLIVAKGYNHFELSETIGHPYGAIGRAPLEMMKLG